MKGIVYIYTFPNGKKYIGQTIQKLDDRAKNGEGYRNCPYVYSAIKKYGWYSIKIEIFECKTELEMDALERALISKYKTTNPQFGYNLETGGHSNKHLAETTKQKLREINLGENNPMYGVQHTEEAKRKMGLNNPFSKKVICLETKKIYLSASAAANEVGLKNRAAINHVCNKLPHCKTAGGYHWMWLEDYQKEENLS